jgi:hypothetical protein
MFSAGECYAPALRKTDQTVESGFQWVRSARRISPQLKPGSRSLNLPNHAIRIYNTLKEASSQQNRKNKYVGANPEEHT